jgi:hypothetical protein
MRRNSCFGRFEMGHAEMDSATQAARVRLWKSMLEDFELSWLKDVSGGTAHRIIEMTLKRAASEILNL